MEISKSADGDNAVFTLTGKIDTNTAREVELELFGHIDRLKTSFRVDLSGVSYLSSAGLRVFLGAQKKSKNAGISMVLTGVSKPLQEIFDITGFSGVLTIEQ